MRVISQSGMVDLPYENVALTVDKSDGYVIHGHTSYEDKACLLAKYSTEEKALKAMEMLLTTYTNFQTYKDGRGNYFAFNYPKLFRFPADEDVEE